MDESHLTTGNARRNSILCRDQSFAYLNYKDKSESDKVSYEKLHMPNNKKCDRITSQSA